MTNDKLLYFSLISQRKSGCHFHFKNDKFVKNDKRFLTKLDAPSELQTHLTTFCQK